MLKKALIAFLLCAGLFLPAESQFGPDAMMRPQGDDGVMIQFCNRTKFPTIYVATAMQLPNGKLWIRGWWQVHRGRCTNTYRHTTGRFWYYGETPDRNNAWQGQAHEQARLCVRSDRFELFLTEEDVGMDGCERENAREVAFGSDVTYGSDQRGGFFIPFIDSRR
jgi:uncharacterized membrane protein